MIYIGSDHGGFAMKQEILRHFEEKGIEYHDVGCYDTASVDYPGYAEQVALAVSDGTAEKGIILCTTGIGVSIAANKVRGVRCALCGDVVSASLTRQHNDANMLALGGEIIGKRTALEIVDIFLTTPFSGEEKHCRRIRGIADIEARQAGE